MGQYFECPKCHKEIDLEPVCPECDTTSALRARVAELEHSASYQAQRASLAETERAELESTERLQTATICTMGNKVADLEAELTRRPNSITCAGKHGQVLQILDCPLCLQEDIAALLEALEKYGRHESLCNAKRFAGHPSGDPGPCTCGFSAALAQTAGDRQNTEKKCT